MVSTRGVKLKFSEGERVLCYEPDPTKAKVLYDSKVLDVIVSKDPRGRKIVEYLIHFQGWNSSWDRYVSEEYVLKDTPENRQLQKDLADKSQLQLGAYLYRKERKKHSGPKLNERIAPSSDEGSSCSPMRMDTDDGHGPTSSSEDESSGDEETIPIELTADLKECLETDNHLINTKNKLHKLPAEPNVVNILEGYWRHYSTNQLCDLTEKSNSGAKRCPQGNQVKRKPEDIQKNLTVCREVLDGLRVYFDFTLNDLLLYKSEQNQVQTIPPVYTSSDQIGKDEINNKHDMDYTDYHTNLIDDEFASNDSKPSARKRTLRSNKSTEVQLNGNNSIPENTNNIKPSSSVGSNSSEVSSSMAKTISWRLLPEHVYSQQPPPPCLIYGATHLTRLFVQLPELLNSSNIDEHKLKVLLQHLDSLIDFLGEHREWFGEKFYVDK